MSQNTVNFLKHVGLQTLVSGSYSLTDEQAITTVQHIYNNGINTGDTVVDAEMPASQLGVTLDWTEGAPNDLTVKFNKGEWEAIQDLTQPNVPPTIPFRIVTLNGGDIVGDGQNGIEINEIVVFGNYIVFLGNYSGAKVASYNYVTQTWHSANSGTGISNDGTALGESDFRASASYGGNFVIAGASGRIASWDGTNWKNYDGSGTGTGPYNDGTAVNSNEISGSISYSTYLVVATNSGEVASWDGSNWKNYDGTGSGTGPYDNQNVVGNPVGFVSMAEYDGDLVLCGAGRVGSWDGSNWKNYDGTGSGTGPYDNQNVVGNTSYRSLCNYSTFLVVVGGSGRVGSWDGSNWKNYDGTGTGTGPYDNANVVGSYDCMDAIVYGTYLIICGRSGLGSWDGSNWKNYNGSGSGTGPYNNGDVNGNVDMYAVGVGDGDLLVGGYGGAYGSWDGSNWKEYDGDGTGTGLYGHIWGNEEDAYTSIEFNSHLVVGSSAGSVSSYNFSTQVWNEYDKTGEGLWNNQIALGQVYIFDMIIYNDNLVLVGNNGRVASFDGTNWKNYDGTGTGTGPYNDGTAMNNQLIDAVSVYNGNLVIGGGSGYVASFDGSNWKNYDGSGTGTGPYDGGTAMGSSSIRSSIVYDGDLVIGGSNGRVASWDGSNWKNYDGSGTGTGPYNSGTALGTESYRSAFFMVEYNNTIVTGSSYHGRIASWDGSNWKNYDGTGTGTGPYNNETALGGSGVLSATILDSDLIVAGVSGRVASWDGSNWKNYDGTGTGTGPYNDGTVVGGSGITIRSMTQRGDGFYVVAARERVGCYDGTTWHNYDD